MAPLTAIARTTSMVMLSATSLFAQRTAIIEKPPISPTLLQQLPLAAPANLALTPAGTSASLRWDAVSGATGYLVTRTSAMYGTIQQTPTPITSTSFTDVSQQFDPRYIFTYRVMAVYPDGRYSASSVTYLPPPPSVSFPVTSGGCYSHGWERFTTNWVGVSEATGYVVRYKMHMDNGWGSTYSVDTSIAVPASPTSHYVGEKCPGSAPGIYGVKLISQVAVYSMFADGTRSAATLCPTCSPMPWPVDWVH